MYIWIGCKLPAGFEREVRAFCLEQNRDIGLNTVAFTLPQHISLKISFEAQVYASILEALADYLSGQKPFAVRMQKPERMGNILWLPVAENPQLQRLHMELDARLESNFGVPQHPFDKAFMFHSTLFVDEDTAKLSVMEKLLTANFADQELTVDTFLLGLSETGQPGTYRVAKTICLSEM